MNTIEDTPTLTEREAAAAVLSTIAGTLFSAAEVLLEAVQANSTVQCNSKDALIMAARALVTEAGMLADRSAKACGDSVNIQDDEQWLLAPSTLQALHVLEGRSVEEG